jgi:hypothetical protein
LGEGTNTEGVPVAAPVKSTFSHRISQVAVLRLPVNRVNNWKSRRMVLGKPITASYHPGNSSSVKEESFGASRFISMGRNSGKFRCGFLTRAHQKYLAAGPRGRVYCGAPAVLVVSFTLSNIIPRE